MKTNQIFKAEKSVFIFVILFILVMIGLMNKATAQLLSPISPIQNALLVKEYQGKLASIKPGVDYAIDFVKKEQYKEIVFELSQIDTSQDYSLQLKLVPKYSFQIFDNVSGVFTGEWKQVNNVLNNKYKHTIAYSNNPQALCTFIFFGNGFELIGEKDPRHGILSITIDGNTPEIVDCYHTSLVEQVIVYGKELPKGTHTVVIRPTGLKNNESTETNIVIDAFRVRK